MTRGTAVAVLGLAFVVVALTSLLVTQAGDQAAPAPTTPAPQAPPPAPTRASLGTPFDLGDAHGCVVDEAAPFLAERRAPEHPGRAPADVLVLRVKAHCASGQRQLERAHWTWIAQTGRVRAASERTTTPEVAPPHVQRVFEAPMDESIPPLRWRFTPQGAVAPTGAGELRIRSAQGAVDVALRQAPDDMELHDALARVLAALRQGHTPPSCTDGCARRVRRALEAHAFEASSLDLVRFEPPKQDEAPDGMRLWLASTETPQTPAVQLRLERRGSTWQLTDVRTPSAPSSPSRCTALQASQRAQLRAAFAATRGQGEECNVMGWLLPGSCAQATRDERQLTRGLRLAQACGDPHAHALLAAPHAPLPQGLHITMRRDRCRGTLDRCPRYTLALYGNGATVFHGKHHVQSLGRSDGRTHPRLLAGLWHRLQEMDFLGRTGGFNPASHCAARGSDRGNLLRVEAAGRSRMVVDREGCRGNFNAEELAQLADLIDAVASVELWTGARPAYADRKAEEWTVSAKAP